MATELIAQVQALAPDLTLRDKADRPAVVVPLARLHAVLARLQQEPALAFDFLLAHTAIDWLGKTPETSTFELTYQLYSTRHRHFLLVSAHVPRSTPVAPSVCDLWRTAEWQEREVYDLFGVQYDGHPDLRRVLLDDAWQGHPLRKDYEDPFMLERP